MTRTPLSPAPNDSGGSRVATPVDTPISRNAAFTDADRNDVGL
jgi:hypothetical protein